MNRRPRWVIRRKREQSRTQQWHERMRARRESLNFGLTLFFGTVGIISIVLPVALTLTSGDLSSSQS